MLSYKKLFEILKERGISSYVMRYEWGIGNATIERLKRNDSVSTNTLDKMCKYLSCEVEDIVEYIPDGETTGMITIDVSDMPDDKITFADRLRCIMEKYNMTGSSLERLSGVKRQSISVYLRGITQPSEKTIQKFARALGINPDDLKEKKN